MGMTWHRKSEILTTNNDRLSKVFDWLKSYSKNKEELDELNKGDCSILFSSIGYGCFGSDDEDKIFYRNDFIDNCIDGDYDLVNEIFFKRFSFYCTWGSDLFNSFADEDGDNKIEKLPEEIDYKKIRLKPRMK